MEIKIDTGLMAREIINELNSRSRPFVYDAFERYPLKEVMAEIAKRPEIETKWENYSTTMPYYTLKSWQTITETLLLIYFNCINYQDMEPQEIGPYEGAIVHLEDKDKTTWFENLTHVSFNLFYPNILRKINEQGRTEYNYTDFPHLYEKIVLYYQDNKDSIDEETRFPFRVWINMVYGLLHSKHKILVSNRQGPHICQSIAARGRMVVGKLIKEFPGHIVYADTDSFYINHYDEIQERLEKELNRLRYLTWNKEDCSGLFFAKKKYVLQEPSGLKVKGFRRR